MPPPEIFQKRYKGDLKRSSPLPKFLKSLMSPHPTITSGRVRDWQSFQNQLINGFSFPEFHCFLQELSEF